MALDLDRIQVATPCTARWEDMKGEGAARFCGECNKHVYDLSGMERAAVEKLVRETEGRLCVRFYKRADGTLLTADCPVGLAARARRTARRAASFVASLLGLGVLAGCPDEPKPVARPGATTSGPAKADPAKTDPAKPPAKPDDTARPTMGEMCMPPDSPAATLGTFTTTTQPANGK